jgi:DNA-binding transcriptional ArsR family regulator
VVTLKQMPKCLEPAEPEIDRVFQALADPSRRAMVDRLTRGPASVSELARPLAMSLPAVVQHLHLLEASGLVRTAWERRLDRLGEFLAEQTSKPDQESTQ